MSAIDFAKIHELVLDIYCLQKSITYRHTSACDRVHHQPPLCSWHLIIIDNNQYNQSIIKLICVDNKHLTDTASGENTNKIYDIYFFKASRKLLIHRNKNLSIPHCLRCYTIILLRTKMGCFSKVNCRYT